MTCSKLLTTPSKDAVHAKINALFCELIKVGWNDLFLSHFTLGNSTAVDVDLVDWIIRGEIDGLCHETDRRTLAWTEIQRESSLNEILHFLRNSTGDVNFTDSTGQTILHVFLRSSLDLLPRKTSLRVVRTLLHLGASVDAVDEDMYTPLHIAAEKMEKSLLKLMLPSFTNVAAASGFNADTVLHDVVYSCTKDSPSHEPKYTEIARALVSKGADPNAANGSGCTPLQLAVEFNFYEMLRIFGANGADFRARTSDDETLLHLVCKGDQKPAGLLKILDLLAREGCDVNAKDKSGASPLHRAAKLRCPRVLERLVQLGGDVHSRTKDLKLTPLHSAASSNQPNNVETLLRAGAQVDAEDASGVTPLHVAASRDGVKTVKCLIGGGADVHRRERTFGFAPLHVAAAGCKKNAEVLLKKGAKVDVPSCEGVTPLHLAALAGNARVARVLTERAADVNCRAGGSKLTPLHLTAMWDNTKEVGTLVFKGENLQDGKFHGMFGWISSLRTDRENVAVAEHLVKCGGDANAKDATGRTPLHLAAASGMIETLLKLGAHADEVDAEGRSVARNVAESGNLAGLKLLVKFGVDVNDVEVAGGESKTVGYLRGHAMKLKMLGLPVRHDCSKREADERKNVELEWLKNRTIDGTDVTLYEFLRMKARRRASLAKRVTSMDLKDQFYEFFDVIEASCRRAVNRAKLLAPATTALRKTTNTRWPDLCVEEMLSRFGDRCLRNLVASAGMSGVMG